MGLDAGHAARAASPIDRVFIGSCTNSRLEDLRAAAAVAARRGKARRCRRWWCPGSGLVKRAGRGRRARPRLPRRRLRVARAGCSMCVGMNGDLVAARASAAPRPRTATSRAARARARARTSMSPAMAAAAAVTRPHHRRARNCLERATMATVHHASPRSPCRSSRATSTPTRSSRRASCASRARRATASFLFHDLRFDADGSRAAVRRSNRPAYRGAQHPGRRRELRLRLVARGRGLGARRLRLPRVDRAVLRRHLPQQLLQERRAADPAAAGAIAALLGDASRRPAPRSRSTCRRRRSRAATALERFEIEPFRKECLLAGIDEIDLTLRHQAADPALRQAPAGAPAVAAAGARGAKA